MLRSLVWLVAGLLLFAAVVVLSAPELVSRDLAGTGQLVLVAGMAGIPGVLVVLTIAVRRRGRPDEDGTPEPDDPTRQHRRPDPLIRRDHTDQEQ